MGLLSVHWSITSTQTLSTTQNWFHNSGDRISHLHSGWQSKYLFTFDSGRSSPPVFLLFFQRESRNPSTVGRRWYGDDEETRLEMRFYVRPGNVPPPQRQINLRKLNCPIDFHFHFQAFLSQWRSSKTNLYSTFYIYKNLF